MMDIFYVKVYMLASQTCWDKRCDPMAIVTESTVGIAIGIPPMRSTRRLSIPVRYDLFWMPHIAIISISIPMAIEQIQKFPIAVKTCKKLITYIMLFERWKLHTQALGIKERMFLSTSKNSEERQSGFETCLPSVVQKTNLLEMSNMCGILHEMSCFAKECMNSSCYHNCFNFTLLTCWTWINPITRILGYWKGFSSKCRLQEKINTLPLTIFLIHDDVKTIEEEVIYYCMESTSHQNIY